MTVSVYRLLNYDPTGDLLLLIRPGLGSLAAILE